MTYRLEPIPTLTTLRVVSDNRTVGFLYPPKASIRPDWEITPHGGDIGGLPDGDRGFRTRHFVTEADALAFLGIGVEERAVA